MIERTIKIIGNPDIEFTSNMEKAIGYLSRWAFHNPKRCNVQLFIEPDNSIHAVYRDSDGACNYTIYAMLNPTGEYSFHS